MQLGLELMRAVFMAAIFIFSLSDCLFCEMRIGFSSVGGKTSGRREKGKEATKGDTNNRFGGNRNPLQPLKLRLRYVAPPIIWAIFCPLLGRLGLSLKFGPSCHIWGEWNLGRNILYETQTRNPLGYLR
ncbi:hypothetical protein L484_028018 [Morus notabilis]|uniref:Uncharacterized protein n=1 Tax=Morus notabilis TaxID=981085 RepID=W9SIA7_9ROSA|nr:hypothetical protein L484_028018 [Morus notabilis]